MPSLRCSNTCNAWWPPLPEFQTCPECGERCWRCSEDPMPVDEAKSRQAHALFEKWLEANERK